jgi:hypothetical protein
MCRRQAAGSAKLAGRTELRVLRYGLKRRSTGLEGRKDVKMPMKGQ